MDNTCLHIKKYITTQKDKQVNTIKIHSKESYENQEALEIKNISRDLNQKIFISRTQKVRNIDRHILCVPLKYLPLSMGRLLFQQLPGSFQDDIKRGFQPFSSLRTKTFPKPKVTYLIICSSILPSASAATTRTFQYNIKRHCFHQTKISIFQDLQIIHRYGEELQYKIQIYRKKYREFLTCFTPSWVKVMMPLGGGETCCQFPVFYIVVILCTYV